MVAFIIFLTIGVVYIPCAEYRIWEVALDLEEMSYSFESHDML